jgi:hypothetical protein
MLRLIGNLRDEKIVRVVCFDPAPVPTAQARDEQMAVRLAAAAAKYPRAKLVVLSGNVHSRLEQGTHWDQTYKPAAFELAKKIPAIVNFNLKYESGTIWACMDEKPCGENRVTGNPWPGKSPYYIGIAAKPEEGHMGTLFSRRVTASPPAADSAQKSKDKK